MNFEWPQSVLGDDLTALALVEDTRLTASHKKNSLKVAITRPSLQRFGTDMTCSTRFSRFATVLFFAACAGIGAASAAEYPARPVKWVVLYPPGGNNIGTVMVVTNSLLVKTVAEFIAYCKANLSKVNAEVNRALADPKMP